LQQALLTGELNVKSLVNGIEKNAAEFFLAIENNEIFLVKGML
jgi:hypothetical protein